MPINPGQEPISDLKLIFGPILDRLLEGTGFTREQLPDIIQSTRTGDIFNNNAFSTADPLFETQSFSKVGNTSNIIGLPPAAYGIEDADVLNTVLASAPMLSINPALPAGPLIDSSEVAGGSDNSEDKGIKLYRLDFEAGKAKYEEILKSCNVDIPTEYPIRVVFQNEGPIAESWSNEYTESMFEQIGNLNVPFLRELRYITGQNTIKGIIGEIEKRYKAESPKEADDFSSKINKIMRDLGGSAIHGAGAAAGFVEDFLSKAAGPGAHKLLMGSNIDFPMIWAGSSYGPSYTITVRLSAHNPYKSFEYEEYIVKPLIKLLSLGIPISDSVSTYSYPLVCAVNCPGLFRLNSAYISNIEVIKGIDGTDIGYHQRPGTVDVRITFGDLYSSMISYLSKHQPTGEVTRPTLRDYANNLRSMAIPPNPYKMPTFSIGSAKYNSTNPISKMVDVSSSHVPTPPGGSRRIRISRDVTTEEKTDYTELKAEKGNLTIDEYNRLISQKTLGNPNTEDIWRSYKTQKSFVAE